MILFNENEKRQLLENNAASPNDLLHKPVVRLFVPDSNRVWLISEISNTQQNLAFGLTSLDILGGRLAYFDIDKLEAFKDYHDRRIVKDETFSPTHSLANYFLACEKAGSFTENKSLLDLHVLDMSTSYIIKTDRDLSGLNSVIDKSQWYPPPQY